MKWAPVPWKSSDFAPRGISFPEKLCYTTHITVKFLPFCQLGFVSAIPAPPQTSLRRKPSPKALPHKALGGQDYYLHFPARGRKRQTQVPVETFTEGLLLTFPRKGTETRCAGYTAPVRLRIITYISPQGDGNLWSRGCYCRYDWIITYISPQGDGNFTS